MYKYLLFITILTSVLSCQTDKIDTSNTRVYFCNSEKTIQSGNDNILIDDSLFEYGKNRIISTKFSHSGNQSIILDSTHQFGFSFVLKEINPYDKIEVEFWQLNDGNDNNCLIVADSPDDSFYKTSAIKSTKEGEWTLIKGEFEIPIYYVKNEISIYIWNNTKNLKYIDDFKIKLTPKKINTDSIELDKLYLNLSNQTIDSLSKYRNIGIEEGLLKRHPDDYYNIEVKYKKLSSRGKIRLKGDWPDHLYGNKWSYRIKLEDNTIDGIQIFSIQNPYTRGFLNEYVFHKLLQQENILTPEYRFIHLYINNKSYGIYALEEHLTDRIWKKNNRGEGIILKYDEKPFWDEMQKPEELRNMNNLVDKSEIKTYGRSENNNAISDAIRCVNLYRKQDSLLLSHIDVESFAKYYALCDITRAYHAMGWINIRFFYNSKNQKIEPIGYDAYPATNYMTWANPYLGFNKNHLQYKKYDAEALIFQVFENKSFNEIYSKYLNRFIDSTYINDFLEKNRIEIDFLEKQLKIEFPNYNYDRNFIYLNASEIKASFK